MIATREVHSATINGRSFDISIWSDGKINVRPSGGDWMTLEQCDERLRYDVQELVREIQ